MWVSWLPVLFEALTLQLHPPISHFYHCGAIEREINWGGICLWGCWIKQSIVNIHGMCCQLTMFNCIVYICALYQYCIYDELTAIIMIKETFFFLVLCFVTYRLKSNLLFNHIFKYKFWFFHVSNFGIWTIPKSEWSSGSFSLEHLKTLVQR